jgi:hypothetical protein
VYGEVTVDSVKVARGSISFFPAGDTVGPSATTAIVNGRYEFADSNGPYAGTYRVTVGVIALEQGDRDSNTVVDASEEAANVKAGVTRSPRRRKSGAATNTEHTGPWTTECRINARGDDRQNFDFVSESP